MIQYDYIVAKLTDEVKLPGQIVVAIQVWQIEVIKHDRVLRI